MSRDIPQIMKLEAKVGFERNGEKSHEVITAIGLKHITLSAVIYVVRVDDLAINGKHILTDVFDLEIQYDENGKHFSMVRDSIDIRWTTSRDVTINDLAKWIDDNVNYLMSDAEFWSIMVVSIESDVMSPWTPPVAISILEDLSF